MLSQQTGVSLLRPHRDRREQRQGEGGQIRAAALDADRRTAALEADALQAVVGPRPVLEPEAQSADRLPAWAAIALRAGGDLRVQHQAVRIIDADRVARGGRRIAELGRRRRLPLAPIPVELVAAVRILLEEQQRSPRAAAGRGRQLTSGGTAVAIK